MAMQRSVKSMSAEMRLVMKKYLLIVGVLIALVAAYSAFAEPPMCNVDQAWVVPPDGAIAAFRTTERAFAVGAESGGAHVPPRAGGERYPAPGGCESFPGQCVYNQSTCSAGCISTVGFYCSLCTCWSHQFPDC